MLLMLLCSKVSSSAAKLTIFIAMEPGVRSNVVSRVCRSQFPTQNEWVGQSAAQGNPTKKPAPDFPERALVWSEALLHFIFVDAPPSFSGMLMPGQSVGWPSF